VKKTNINQNELPPKGEKSVNLGYSQGEVVITKELLWLRGKLQGTLTNWQAIKKKVQVYRKGATGWELLTNLTRT